MQDNSNTNIRLVVGGYECDQWDEANIDSQIDVPADGWSLTLFNPAAGNLPDAIKASAPIELYYGDELVLTGIIDRLAESVNRSGRYLTISGRDLAGQLLDCSAAVMTSQQLNITEIIKQFVTGDKQTSNLTPFQELKVDSDLTLDSFQKNKVTVEPGESIWDVLAKAAATAGQWVWFTADGTLRIGDPFANPLATVELNLMRSGQNNSVQSLEYTEDLTGVFNEIKVLSQNDDADAILAEGSSKTPYKTPRLKIVPLSDIDTQEEAQAALNKIKHDNDLEAYSLTAVVSGWGAGPYVWQAGWLVTLKTDVLIRANAQWVIMGRTLNLSRRDGKTTILKLKRQGDWAQPLIYKDSQDDDTDY